MEPIQDADQANSSEMIAFCRELDETIRKAEAVIDKTYAQKGQLNKDLQESLKKYVRKLHSLQIEMKAIYENIVSLKTKIKAVKLNLKDHQKQFDILKDEQDFQKSKYAALASAAPFKRSDIPLSTRRSLDSNASIAKSPKVTFLGSQSKKVRPTRRRILGNMFPKPVENGVTLFLHPLDNDEADEDQYEDIAEEPPSMSKVEASMPDIEPEITRTPTPIPSLASISWRSTRMSIQSSGTNNSISSSRQGFFPMNFDDPDDID